VRCPWLDNVEARLAEAMRAAQEALRATEQDDVEWTEDDMNDPALMAEMERLEKDESIDPLPARSPNVMSTSTSTNIQHQTRPSTGAATATIAVGASEEDEFSAHLLALVNRRIREYYSAAVAAKEAGIATPKTLAANYAALKEMKQTLENGGLVDEDDIPGPPEPLESVPARQQPTAKTTPTKPSTPSRPSSAVSPQQNMENTRRTGTASPASQAASSQPQSPSTTSNSGFSATSTPSQTISSPPVLSPAEIREKKFTQLHSMLLAQAEELKKQALDASAKGKRSEAMEIINRRKALVRDLELLKLAHSTPGTPPPTFHIDTIEHTTEIVNADVSAHEVEIDIHNLEDVKPPSLQETVLDLYVVIEFPYPDPNKPTLITTPVIKGTLSPVFNFIQKLRIDRNKALLRAFTKKKVVFQVWKPKSWFLGSAKMIGKAEMKIAQLTDISEIHESLDILDESGRQITGGKLHASVRLRTPLLKKQVTVVREKVLVIDKHHIGETANDPAHPELAPQHSRQIDPLTQSTMASITSVAPATKVAENNLSESRISASDLQMSVVPGSSAPGSSSDMPGQEPTLPSGSVSPGGNLINLDDESPHYAPSGTQIDDYSVPLVPQQNSMDLTDPSSTTRPETSHSTQASSSSPSVAPSVQDSGSTPQKKEGEAEEFDFNSARWIISHSVLQWRKDVLEAQIAALKQKKAPEDEIDALDAAKGDIEHKMTILIVLVQSGQLSEEEYIRRVKVKLGEEDELFQRLISVGRTAEAADCKKRIQIMKEEIGA
jgi:hypothetical protein